MKSSFIILGCRGTTPAVGRAFAKYGGHTTCFCMQTGKGKVIADAGTGLSLLNESEKEKSLPATLLFTHFHLDHLIGLPFLKRINHRKSSLEIMADASRKGWQRALADLFDYPYWPPLIKKAEARIRFHPLFPARQPVMRHGVRIRWQRLHHPQGSLAYRLEAAGHSVVIATDYEYGNAEIDAAMVEFCAKAEYLIFDAHYKPEEMKKFRGWGHSSWKEAVELAEKTGIKEIILTHHHFKRTDAEIDEIVNTARRYFPKIRAAAQGMVLF
jgi:phosphoribosyl 1,2-cyclic phosphodiesterase